MTPATWWSRWADGDTPRRRLVARPVGEMSWDSLIAVSSRPRLILVVGAGRSGTSAFSGAVAGLGYAVPQPEIASDDTNPRGFGEPRWAVGFHSAMMRPDRVGNLDARPYAWKLTRAAGEREESIATLRTWLAEQFDQHDRVVVKDPRTAWFLPLWKQVAAELEIEAAFVTMLRPPAEVVASARRWYSEGHHETSRLGGWANVLLRTENLTRHSNRAFVRYSDLLADWKRTLKRIDRSLDLGLDLRDRTAVANVEGWLDPGLRRERDTLDDVDAPTSLRVVVEKVWAALNALVDKDDAAARQQFDVLRAEYRTLYRDSERIAHASIAAARPRRPAKAAAAAQQPSEAAPAAPEEPAEPATAPESQAEAEPASYPVAP
jgi:hypothetical protein